MTEGPHIWLATMPPSRRQRDITKIAVAVLATAFVIVAPFASIGLPPTGGFIPIVQAILFLSDLIAAVLLFNQFSVVRSRALLALAGGYLVTALIVISHTLSFPGALAPHGLIGGPQTTGWLHIIWHFCFPASIIAYAILKQQNRLIDVPPGRAIGWAVAAATGAVLVLTFGVTAGHAYLPRLFLNQVTFSPLVLYMGLFDTAVTVVALVLLERDRDSALSQWLIISIAATTAEMAMVTLFSTGRFDLGWYAVRIFSLVSSTVVLIALLAESARLYGKLAHTILRLRHENDSKLFNLEAIAALFSHELKQPLSSISLESEMALLYLDHRPVDIEQLRESLNSILGASKRTVDVLDTIRSLGRPQLDPLKPVDLQAIALDALNLLRVKLNEHHILVDADFDPALPAVIGRRGQLFQVTMNLIHNAVEAMMSINIRDRVLTLRTGRLDEDHVALIVEDTGPGISPEMLSNIFDPFVTSKPFGTGLGLALSRTVADRHLGQILVSSELGKGAQFRLVLPTRAAISVEQTDSAPALPATVAHGR